MGFPMCRNLAQAGFDVSAWNRTAEKAAGLADFGVTVCASPAEAVAEAGIVITIVSDGAALQGLIGQCGPSLSTGAVWVDMSSTRADEAVAAAQAVTEQGGAFLDAPVSGGTKGADAASLAIMAGGAAEAYATALPALQALGRPVHVGPTGAGQMCKLANQAIVAITIGAVAEAQLFLEAGGVDTDAMREALRGGFADSTILQQHGSRMARRDFVPGGPSRLQLKDIRNVQHEAEALGLSLPLVDLQGQRYQRYVDDLDGGERDHSGLFEELLDLNAKA
jgi:2-hydroxy-3-oxopropionate reductase